ncbi:hypothetical protein IFO70_06830 [Phormidium tenue FACHB-886]|nr:hypothetical protein [Phormidium tenue FACHB-886]
MPKRFTIGPLGEHDDHWLAVWAALTGRSKAALATSIVGIQVNQYKETIRELLEHSARLRGVTSDELFSAILVNPRYLEENSIVEEEEDDDLPSTQ